jgi:hypothetical protein
MKAKKDPVRTLRAANPAPTVNILREKAELTPEQEEFLASHPYTASE